MKFEYKSNLFDIEGSSHNDDIYQSIVRSGTFYETDLLEYIYRLKPFIYSKQCKNIALDVGANIGNHSIYFSSFIVDYLIAIEPNPGVLPTLRRNLSVNIDNYTIYEIAVGEKKGKGAMIVPENMVNNIGATKVDTQNTAGDIEISTLDLVFSSWKVKENSPVSISLIKIDVEGMETQVLKGAENIIQEYKPHIFAEAATKEELQRINTYLVTLGYRKLPGHCAATPVYHFAHKPGLELLVTALYSQLRRSILKTQTRLRKSIRKRLNSLSLPS